MSSLTQEDSSINAYYTKFKGAWDDFSNYRTCTCGHQDKECTMAFLMGLNGIYAGEGIDLAHGSSSSIICRRGHRSCLWVQFLHCLRCFLIFFKIKKQRKVGSGHAVQAESVALVSKTTNSY